MADSPGALRVGLLLTMIGLTAFGGPAAHVALMQRSIVEKRRWIDPREFGRMFAACNLIPGPSSTELGMFLGYRLAGWPGLLLAAVCFIAPATAIMLGLAYAYDRFAGFPAAHGLLYGVRPVVVGIVVWAALDLSRKLVEERALLALVPAALLLSVFGVNPLLILVAGALAGLALRGAVARGPAVFAAALAPHLERLIPLFLTFLKIGAVAFGSGYVLFAFLDADLVRGLHWVRPEQLADAVAISQITPGPVFTVATFLGFAVGGLAGGLLATVAIFMPGLLLVPLLDRIVRLVDAHSLLRVLLDAVNAAVIGLILGAGYELARVSVVDAAGALLAALAFLLVLWRPLLAPLAVGIGGIVGLFLRLHR